ncbi:hypothetical protein [Clostridium saccharoperbutylacetonicum]
MIVKRCSKIKEKLLEQTKDLDIDEIRIDLEVVKNKILMQNRR